MRSPPVVPASISSSTRYARVALVAETALAADAKLADMLGCEAGETWLRFQMLRRLVRMRVPVAAVYVWLRPEFGAIAADFKARPSALISLLEQRFGVKLSELQQD